LGSPSRCPQQQREGTTFSVSDMSAEIIQTPVTIALVGQIYDLTAAIDALKVRLDDAKLSLILASAPVEIAAKIRSEELLTEAERVALDKAVSGKYSDGGTRVATVVVPTAGKTTFDLYPAEVYAEFLEKKGVKKSTPALAREFQAAREAAARELAGDEFRTLFERVELFKPCKGFDDVAARVFARAKARLAAVLQLCRLQAKPAAPHVKIAKATTDDE
jgi:hypothetical protein